MDKEVTVPEAWFLSALCAVTGLLVSRRWPWLVAVPLLAVLVATWAVYSELRDPFLGPALRVEVGQGYALRVFLPLCLAAIVLVAAFFRALWRRKRAA